jgi:hypothetical protein
VFLQERSLEDRIWCALCRDSVVGVSIATDWAIRGSNHGGGEIFSTRLDPAFCKIDPGFLSQGLVLTTHPRVALRLKKE